MIYLHTTFQILLCTCYVQILIHINFRFRALQVINITVGPKAKKILHSCHVVFYIPQKIPLPIGAYFLRSLTIHHKSKVIPMQDMEALRVARG
jgi:hypothetical protein